MKRVVCDFLHDASSARSRIACNSGKQKMYGVNHIFIKNELL